MRDFVSADLAQPRFTMLLLGTFAAAALLLAAIGLYGVIAFGVTQRTREIGVRVALGAPYRNVLRLVVQHGMLLTGTGLVIGTAAALALGRVMSGLLYGVTPSDPATLLAVSLFLAAVAMLATYKSHPLDGGARLRGGHVRLKRPAMPCALSVSGPVHRDRDVIQREVQLLLQTTLC